MAAANWHLTAEQRSETVRRTADNLFALAYSRKKPVSDKQAYEAAQQIEEKAFNVARIESQTTSGQRPADESVRAYTRQDFMFVGLKNLLIV